MMNLKKRILAVAKKHKGRATAEAIANEIGCSAYYARKVVKVAGVARPRPGKPPSFAAMQKWIALGKATARMTNREIADACGVTPTTVKNWQVRRAEAGKNWRNVYPFNVKA